MEDDELVGASVVEPFVERGSFPDGIEVESDGVGAGDDGSGDDVVSIHERASDWLANPVNVNGRGSDESDDEARRGGEQTRNHQNAEPTNIEAVIC